ncbi:response regulator [Paenibacillus donghaensis]|uniref:DNA-binding response regulator n=1 Tax=Paenibacillus donghaensis TaxID=414771 RepID=A0A2Z2KJN4_9BACL|nr:response regulator [Paenibacillus donghaensis]ASA23483.1 hypothetical protein B9T62_23375 [Paenibacillus donghaensis]
MRILIADDDEFTREALIESIRWESYGIEQVLEARDGIEAVRMASRYHPDIVLTDIRMPKLNGIDFAERLTEICPSSKLLFMSGYLDVDYLKSAIRLAALDYIEKPIRIDELELAIKKTTELVQSSQRKELESYKTRDIERQRLVRILIDKSARTEEIKGICEVVNFPLNTQYVALCVTEIQSLKNENDNISLVNEFWNNQNIPCIGDYLGNGEYAFILSVVKMDLRRLESLARYLLSQYPKEFYAGIGSKVFKLREVVDSWEKARKASEICFFFPDIYLSVYDESFLKRTSSSQGYHMEFLNLMKSSPNHLPEWIDRVSQSFIFQKAYEKDKFCSLFITIANTLVNEESSLLLKVEQLYHTADIGQIVRSNRTVNQLNQFMQELCQEYLEVINRNSRYSLITRGVIKYVVNHCSKTDLDVQEVAYHMHLSVPHLNMLFKQDVGTTVSQYIRDYRIEQAKKLIANNSYKMNAISEMCGFATPSYFTRVFGDCTGMSPWNIGSSWAIYEAECSA